jgi:hypothetical protein
VSKKSLPQARNYWVTCGKEKEKIEKGPCSNSVPERSATGRIIKEPDNEWWINSERDGYCFWRWIQRNSLPDGRMDAMQQNEIAKLFGCSATKIHFIIKEAIEKLKNNGNIDLLKDFLEPDVLNGCDNTIKAQPLYSLEDSSD